MMTSMDMIGFNEIWNILALWSPRQVVLDDYLFLDREPHVKSVVLSFFEFLRDYSDFKREVLQWDYEAPFCLILGLVGT